MNELHTEPQLPAGAVVVGYDETDVASRALDWAADLADKESRPLVVVHATGSVGTAGTTWLNVADAATEPTLIGTEKQGQVLLAKAIAHVAERHPSLGAVPLVAIEDTVAELVRLSHTAHLVVVGSRGHGLSRSIPSGQVGTWLARRTSGPVVVVPDYNPTTVREGVLVGVRAGEDAHEVLEFAYHYASVHDLPLAIVHAAGHQPDADEEQELRRLLAEARSGLSERYPDVWVHDMVLSGRPVRKLLDLAERMNLLVIGQHHATGLRESPFGHVRSSIVDRSPCPTAVVPVHVSEPA